MPNWALFADVLNQDGPLFALVAGESSGDALGAGLIRELSTRFPGARFVGVTGPAMRAVGCQTWAESDALALFGVSEVIGRIPSLLALRRRLARDIENAAPIVFIGIDAPAFNTALEQRLRRRGIATVHYVCPTAWAWRRGRVKTLARADDLLLAIFPFEPEFFARYGINARFVGHPLADRPPPHADAGEARAALGLAGQSPVIAVLPGSRLGEIKRNGPRFLAAIARLHAAHPNIQIVIPAATPALREIVARQLVANCPDRDVVVVDGRARDVMQAADVALVASGTATLECLLLDTPMVVGYVVSPFNAGLVRMFRLLKTPFVAMPNLLAGRAIVPELLQASATPAALADELHHLLVEDHARKAQRDAFADIRDRLSGDADARAADAIADLIKSRP